MLKMALGLLCICLSVSPWQSARAEPWMLAPNSELQSAGGFAPDKFAEFAADGLWTLGYTIHGRQASKQALVRYSVDGRAMAQAFPLDGSVGFLRSLADGGLLYTTSVQGECQVVRLHADGSTAWQSRVGDGNCLALDVDATGAVWVATNLFPTPREVSFLRIFQVIGLREEDGGSVARVVFDDSNQNLFSMRADPLAGGVLLAGNASPNGDLRSARSQVLKLGATGSVEWQWQSAASATASSVKFLQVSATTGIFAVSSPNLPNVAMETNDWLVAGLSLNGVPRFDKKISFGKTVSIIGSSVPTSAGLWLALHHEGSKEGPEDGTLWVVPIAANGKQGDSTEIRSAFACGFGRFNSCQMRARQDGGVWLLSSSGIVGVDSEGRERARVTSVATEIGALPGDRVLGVVGDGRYQPVNVQSVAFGQSPRLWTSLQAPQRALVPVEAIASDGAVAQWLSVGEPATATAASILSFRGSDTSPIAWQVTFNFTGDMRLSISRHMVCIAGSAGVPGDIQRFVLECRHRDDGRVIWADTRPPPPPPVLGLLIGRYQAVAALDDGRAVAISSDSGTMRQWVIGADGEVLADRMLPLVGDFGEGMLLSHATFNTQGDALLTASFQGGPSGILLRLDHDGSERFKTGTGTSYGPLAFASDGGVIYSGRLGYGDREPTLARYRATGEKAWELFTGRAVADLLVVGDDIVYTLPADLGAAGEPQHDWELVGLDAVSGVERWRLALGARARELVGLAQLDPQRVAVLQTERNHLRYREVAVATGAALREQTDSCQGEFCGCTSIFCLPDQMGQSMHVLPSEQLGVVRLRARVGNVLPGSGWGSSVLLLDDAGEVPPTVRADQAGVSGAWYAPWSSGQGLAFDWIAGSRTLFANWLTFAPDGGSDPSGLRWYTLQGELANPSPGATLDIFINEGGRFGVGVTASRRVGSAQLRFESCDRAQFSYQFDPDENEGLSGMVTLSRLTPGVACSGSPAGTNPPTVSDAIDGAWFDPASSGQGLMFNAIPAQDPAQSTVFATWFTYDTETAPDDLRQQHWFTLQGPLGTGDQTTLDIIRTTGGALFRGSTSNSQRVGTATVTRLGCDHLRLDYQFDDSEIAGPFRRIDDFRDLQRIGGCAD